MNIGMGYGSDASIHLCTISNLSTRKSVSESCHRLLFKTYLVKPNISIKTPYGSTYYTTKRRTREAIDNVYATSSSQAEGTETETEDSFYELLGISESSTLSEIKKAYKQLALKYHPDVSPPNRAEEYTRRFIRIQEAYQALSDPKTRALYDIDLAKGLHLAFSRQGFHHDHDQKCGEWKDRWQSQLMELKRRSANKDSNIRGQEGHMSWAAQMRSQRCE